MYFGIIYCAISPSNKKYYGKTVGSLKNRIKSHLENSKNAKCHFSSAIRKYGIEKFNWNIIETIESDSKIELRKILNEKEKYWIKNEKTYDRKIGYNMTPGGDGGAAFGRKLSEETKNKIRKSLEGKKHSEERRKNQSKGSLKEIIKAGYILNQSMVREHSFSSNCRCNSNKRNLSPS